MGLCTQGGIIMQSKAREIIISEIRDTNTVYEKLLKSFTTPVLLTIFKQLFGNEGEFPLSDKGFDYVVEELELHDRLPETTGVKITDALLVDLFIDLYNNIESEDSTSEKVPNEDEQATSHLLLDDLLDLLNLAIYQNDISYANELKRRLLVHNRNANIEAS